jgi:hypothetical protein
MSRSPSGCEVGPDLVRKQRRGRGEGIDPSLRALHPLRNPACRDRIEALYNEAKQYAGAIMIFNPTGALKAAIAEEKAECFETFCETSVTKDKEFALKVNFLIPYLLLQKPVKKLKSEKTRRTLSRDLELWRGGELDDLAARAKQWASRKRESRRRSPFEKLLPPLPTEFASQVQREVAHGRIGSAGGMVSEGKERKGPAPLTEDVKQTLQTLHPKARRTGKELPACKTPPPGMFSFIDGEHIHKCLLKLRGAGGASGCSTDLIRSLGRQKTPEGARLCEAYAGITRAVLEEELPAGCLAPLTINRLIPLQKDGGGIRPVGIGEAERRLIGMTVAGATKTDVQKACGALQTCAGLSGGCEASGLAMQEFWDDPEIEALLLIDARNAFNKASREEALRTAHQRCPSLAVPLRNFYGHESELRLEDGSNLMSEEGTTQGCPLGMAMFCVSSIPLIKEVSTPEMYQVWCADDSGGAGKVTALRAWFGNLTEKGPAYGYEVNLSKTVAIVKPEFLERFRHSFEGLMDEGGIRVVSGGDGNSVGAVVGQRYLGVGVGSPSFREEFVKKKVEEWVAQIHRVAEVAELYPHEAYVLLVRSLIPRWRFVMRTTETSPSLFQPLEDALMDEFFPKTFGWTPKGLSDLRIRCSLAVRNGGLAIPNPCLLANQEHKNCVESNSVLVHAIRSQDWNFVEDRKTLEDRRELRHALSDEEEKQISRNLLSKLKGRDRKGLEEILEGGCSAWLGAVPLEYLGLNLERTTFRDAVALRMGLPMPDPLPPHCGSCGAADFDITHALKCKKGAWVRRRHEEVKHAWTTLFKKVSTTVTEEPYLPFPAGLKVTKKSTSLKLDARADIFVRGVSRPLSSDYYDVAVIDTGTNCHVGKKSLVALRGKESRKKDKYQERVQAAGSFTPLVCSVYGTLAPDAAKTLQLIVRGLDDGKYEQPEKKQMIAMQRVFIQTAIIKATSMCLRSRSSPQPPEVAAFPNNLSDCQGAAADAFERR